MSSTASGTFGSRYGFVHASFPGPEKDLPYDNVNTYVQTETRTITLQGPALRAFKAAEVAITPKRKLKRGKVTHILVTGHGYRSFALQKALFDSEPGRFADPNESNHVEALAVDLDTSQPDFGKRKAALEDQGFHFTVPGEPWHGSFRVPG